MERKDFKYFKSTQSAVWSECSLVGLRRHGDILCCSPGAKNPQHLGRRAGYREARVDLVPELSQ